MYRETYQPFMFIDTLAEMGLPTGRASATAEIGTRALCMEDSTMYVRMSSAWAPAGGNIKPPSPWTPAPGAEIPPIGDTGDQHIIAGLSSPFTTTVPGPNGQPPIGTVLDNGDRLVQNAAGGFDVIPAPKISPKVPDYGIAGATYKRDTLVKAGGVLYVVTQDFAYSGRTLAQEIAAGNLSELHKTVQSVINDSVATADNILKDDILVDLGTGISYIVTVVSHAADSISNLLTANKIVPIGSISDVAIWMTGKSYMKDSVVVDNQTGSIYRVAADYTSGATIADDVTANSLVDITASGIPEEWVTATDYKEGQILNNGTDVLYIVAADYTAGATITADIAANRLVPVAPPTKTEPWATATAYTAGQMVYGSGGEGLFVVTADYTSGVDIATDVAAGSLVPAVNIPNERGGVLYDDTLQYKIGDIITEGDKVYRCIVDITSPEVFNSVKWIELSSIKQYDDIAALTADLANLKEHDIVAVIGESKLLRAQKDAPAITEFDLIAEGNVGHLVLDWVTATDFLKGTIINNGADVLFIASADFTSKATFDLDVTSGDLVPVVTSIPEVYSVATSATPFGVPVPANSIIVDLDTASTYLITVAQADTSSIDAALAALPAEALATSGTEIGGKLYDATETYVVGDIVIESGKAYQCTIDITTAEVFDTTKWVEIGAEVKKKFFAITSSQTTVDFGESLGLDTTVFVNGNLLEPSDFTVAGQIVTYTVALSANDTTTIFSKGLDGAVPVVPTERGGVAYDATLIYKKGDIATVGDKYYMSKFVISVPEVFDPLKWNELGLSITSKVEQVSAPITTYSLTTDITPGMVVRVNGGVLIKGVEYTTAGKIITFLNGGLLAYDKITVLNGIEL